MSDERDSALQHAKDWLDTFPDISKLNEKVEDDPSYLDELINVLKSRDRDLYDKLCLVRSEIPDIISDIVNGIPSQGGSGGCCVVL